MRFELVRWDRDRATTGRVRRRRIQAGTAAIALACAVAAVPLLAGCTAPAGEGASQPVASDVPVSGASATPAPTPGPTASPSVAASIGPVFEFTDRGTVLGPADVGFACCRPSEQFWPGVSDMSAIALPDGQIRLYYNRFDPAPDGSGKPFGIGSAISRDGLSFTVERGDRIAVTKEGQGSASPFVYQLPDGGYRLFYVRGGDTLSSTSKDGLTFTPDAGRRLAADAFRTPDAGPPILSAIVPLGDGRYRGYFTQQLTQGGAGGAGKAVVYSATSQDLLEWTPDPGVRLGEGSALPNDAGHPTVLRTLADGTLILVYHSYDYEFTVVEGDATVPRRSGTSEIVVRSTDGLTFTDPVITGVFGSEVAYAEGPDGTGFLYYGRADQNGGARFGVATVEQLAAGPAVNFVDLPFPTPPGAVFGITVSTAPGATCRTTVSDAAGAAISDTRLAFAPVAGENGMVSWTLPLPTGLAIGTATVEATCTRDGATRKRSATFEIVRG